MVDVEKLSDAEIRTKLLEFGYPVMPITGTTRKLMKKKLKLLLESSNKPNNDGRMSLGRYSSEEESDSDTKSSRREKNRRATMAAPPMQPPTSTTSSRSSRKSQRIEKSNDIPADIVSPSKKESLSSTVTTTTRSQKIVRTARDEFDTGSDSESEIVGNSNFNNSNNRNVDFSRGSSFTSPNSSTRKFSPPKSTIDNSFSRNVSFSTTSPSPSRYLSSQGSASEYASERLNQIRSRLSLGNSGFDKPSYISPISEKYDKEETPFLSNFTRRLSALSSQKNDCDLKNDIIKENDVNGSTSYARTQLSNYRVSRGRDQIYDYKTNQNNILRNNFVSFSVLAGAALFFIFLAIMYLGMRSDTSIVATGKTYTNPYVPEQ